MSGLGKEFSEVIFEEFPIQHKASKLAFQDEAVKFIAKFSKIDVHKLAMKYCKMSNEFFEIKKSKTFKIFI